MLASWLCDRVSGDSRQRCLEAIRDETDHNNGPQYGPRLARSCEDGTNSVVMFGHPGMGEAPYHKFWARRTFQGFSDDVLQRFCEFAAAYKNRSTFEAPNVLVLGTGLWDLMKLNDHDAASLSAISGLGWQAIKDFTNKILATGVALTELAKREFPHTQMSWRTTPRIREDECQGNNRIASGLRLTNHLCRNIAASAGAFVMDMESVLNFIAPQATPI